MLRLHVEQAFLHCTCLHPTMSSGEVPTLAEQGCLHLVWGAEELRDEPIRAKAGIWIVLLHLISRFWQTSQWRKLQICGAKQMRNAARSILGPEWDL